MGGSPREPTATLQESDGAPSPHEDRARRFNQQLSRWSRGLWDWMVKRGVLFVLTQLPMISFLVGIAFKWITYPLITVFTVIPGFVVLPMWIAYRKERSDDPHEPAHNFYTLALWALVPYIVYNIARIPTYFLLDVTFWDHWYAFGATLTGEPADHWSSLFSGTLIHSLQGYVLVLGYYVLFGRGNLKTALAYVFVLLSVIYSTVFPIFILIDFQPGPPWYFVVWWAHFWMAMAAWAVPRLYTPGLWGRVKGRRARAGVSGLLVLVYLSPFIFVFWRASTWQFPLQYKIDQSLFDRARIGVREDPVLTSRDLGSEGEVLYRFILRLGPRIYEDYIKATKVLDAQGVRVTGRLLHKDEVIASCFSHTAAIETPKTILVPARYRAAVEKMEFADIPVDCIGPVAVADRLNVGSEVVGVDIRWTAVATLVGDRNREPRTFGGVVERDVVAGTWRPSLLRPDPAVESRGRIIF